MGLAFELVGMCWGGHYLGQFIDTYYGWNNFAATYVVLALLIGWFLHLIYMIQQFEKDNDNADPKS